MLFHTQFRQAFVHTIHTVAQAMRFLTFGMRSRRHTLESIWVVAIFCVCSAEVAGGFDEPKDDGADPVRRTRVPVVEFQAAISMSSGTQIIDADEVECLLANMIYKVWSHAAQPLGMISQHITDIA